MLGFTVLLSHLLELGTALLSHAHVGQIGPSNCLVEVATLLVLLLAIGARLLVLVRVEDVVLGVDAGLRANLVSVGLVLLLLVEKLALHGIQLLIVV